MSRNRHERDHLILPGAPLGTQRRDKTICRGGSRPIFAMQQKRRCFADPTLDPSSPSKFSVDGVHSAAWISFSTQFRNLWDTVGSGPPTTRPGHVVCWELIVFAGRLFFFFSTHFGFFWSNEKPPQAPISACSSPFHS
ncbi:hypothetical protein FKM82_029164 [Ascaphus truei]